MLEPQSRRLLLESFAPPAGHRLDWAVGTTFSLDLIALLAAPVAFADPEPFNNVRFWPIGIGASGDWPFRDSYDRLLVISPFVDARFIEDLESNGAEMELVSRPESLDELTPAELDPFEKLYVLDETAQPEPDTDSGEPFTGAAARESSGNEQPSVGDLPLVGLHAKVPCCTSG